MDVVYKLQQVVAVLLTLFTIELTKTSQQLLDPHFHELKI